MGRQFLVLGIAIAVGAAVAYAGGPFGPAFAAAYYGAGLLLNKPPDSNTKLPTSTLSGTAAGRPINEGHGTIRLTCPFIFYEDPGQVKQDSETVKALGTEVETYDRYRTIAVSIGRPPTTAGWARLLKVYADKKLIIDNTPGGKTKSWLSSQKDGTAGYLFANGSETQLPDPVLEHRFRDKNPDLGDTPLNAMRGLSFLRIDRVPESKFGGRIASIWEVIVSESATDEFTTDGLQVPAGFSGHVNLSDSYPYAGFRYDPVNGFVYSQVGSNPAGSGFIKYDYLTGEVLNSNPNPWAALGQDAAGNELNDTAGAYCLDKNGQIMALARAPGGVNIARYVYRIDPFTLVAEPGFIFPPNVLIQTGFIQCNYQPLGNNYLCVTHNNGGVLEIIYLTPGAPEEGVHLFTKTTGVDYAETILDVTWDNAVTSLTDPTTPATFWTVGGTALRRWLISGTQPSTAVMTIVDTYDLTAFGSFSLVTYHIDQNILLIAGGSTLLYWDIDGEVGTLSTATHGKFDRSQFTHWIAGNTIASDSASNFYLTNVVTDTVEVYSNTSWATYDTIANKPHFYEPVTQTLWTWNSAETEVGAVDSRVFLPKSLGGGIDLRILNERHLARANYSASQYDMSALAGINVNGVRYDNRTSFRDVVSDLQIGFFYDIVLTDWKLKAILRGTGSILTITEEEMEGSVQIPDPDLDQPLTIVQASLELPLAFEVGFLDLGREYQENVARDIRETEVIRSDLVEAIASPIVHTLDEATTIAAKWLSIRHTESRIFEFSVLLDYLRLDPGDVITITFANRAFIVRVIKVQLGANFILNVSTVEVETDGFTYNTLVKTGEGGGGITPDVVEHIGNTRSFLMDIPLLTENTDYNGFYVAGGPNSSSWTWLGAGIFRSNDGVNFLPWLTLDTSVTWGFATDALPDWPHYTTTDDENTLTVTIVTGATLQSVTHDSFYAGQNVAVLFNSQGSEIIFYKTATLVSGSTWDLDILCRGRLGSEQFTGIHGGGDLFVALNAIASIQDVAEDLSEIGINKFYKTVSIGQDTQIGPVQEFANQGVRITPPAPYYLRGSRDGSDNLTIDFYETSRFNQNEIFVDPASSEVVFQFQLLIYDSTKTTLYRTEIVTAETFSYTAALQTGDGATPGELFHVECRQWSSRLVGYGYVVIEEL